MAPKKILHVIPTLDQSGAEKQMTLLATRLPKDRYEVSVCALTRGGHYEEQLRASGVEVHVLSKRFRWDPIALWRLRELIKTKRPDIVHTWLFAGNSYGRVAARLAGSSLSAPLAGSSLSAPLAGSPRVIASERCVDSWKRKHEFVIDRRLAKWTDVVTANSEAVAAFYESVGIPRDKLRVIPNAVPEGAWAPTVDRETMRASLGIDGKQPTLGFIGRLWPQKRVHDLIWATDVLRISGWDIHLLVAGDGPRRSSLEQFARNLELTPYVHFLGHRTDVDDLLAAIDIVVIPSKFEGMSNLALEAMRAGKPLVATNIAGMDEVVLEGETGLLVEPAKPFLLAKAINKLLTDPDLAQRFGQAGRRRVEESFTLERMLSEYERLYEELK